jgi:hypothetical protein
MIYRCGGHANDTVQTMKSTDDMILANIRNSPPATGHLNPAAWLLQLSMSLDRAPKSIHGSIKSNEIWSVLPLDSVFGSVEPNRLGVSLSAIESVLESVLRSVLESFLRAGLGGYSQAGWVCAIKCKWERPSEHARECT